MSTGHMRLVIGEFLAVALCVGTAIVRAQAPPAIEVPRVAKGYTAPRTPWADPDLQGIWPGIQLVGVPVQRPASFGTRNWLTDDEFEDRLEAAERRAIEDLAEFDVETPDVSNTGAVGSPTSPPPHWLERGTPQRIVSLIVDPLDGGMPPTTEAYKQRQHARNTEAQARRAALQGRVADSYTDRSLYDRCITRGIVEPSCRSSTTTATRSCRAPAGWRSATRCETRIVPLDGRPALDATIRQWMGDSRGRWDGETLAVETTNHDRTAGIGVTGGDTRATEALKVTERITTVFRAGPKFEILSSNSLLGDCTVLPEQHCGVDG